jgi:hypothetical protein
MRLRLALIAILVVASAALAIGAAVRTTTSSPPATHLAEPTDTVVALASPAPTPVPPTAPAEPTPTDIPPTATSTPEATATAVPPTATPAPVRDLFVGPGGYATIGQALLVAAPGATIRIAAGVYHEQVEIAAPVTLVPADAGPVWIDANCQHLNGIRITAANVTVRGLGVMRSIDAGVLVDGQELGAAVANATLDRLTIQDFDCRDQGPEYRAGIAVWFAGPGQRLTANTIIRRVALTGGLTGGKSNGIWFKSNSNHPSGGGHVIAGNTIEGGYDGIGGEKEDDPHGSFDRDTIIEQNTVGDCFDDGIQVEGGTQNVHVRDNTIVRCASGLANAPNLTGPIYFERNTITDGRPGYYGVMQCFKIGDRGHGVAYYTGNHCILGPGADGWGQSNPGVNPIVARDNVIKVGRYIIEINAPIESGTSFDGNCLMTSDPTRYITWGGDRYDDLAAFRRATGQEARGMAQCP